MIGNTGNIIGRRVIGMGAKQSPHAFRQKRRQRVFTNRSNLIFRLPKKERTTLTREMGMQIHKLITRQVHHHMNPYKPSLLMERRLRELEHRVSRSRHGQNQEMDELRRLWAAAVAGRGDGKTPLKAPRVARLLKKGLHGRNPAWLKRRLHHINAQAADGMDRAGNLVLVAPGGRDRPGSPTDSLSREGLALLLNMLNAVPNAPPMLKRFSSRLRRGMPFSILAPNPNPAKKSRIAPRGGMEGQSDELKFRQPLKGVLRMRIEPPEAARALAEQMGFGSTIPLVYKQPAAPKAPKQATSEQKTAVSAADKASANPEIVSGEVARIARAARAAIRKDLLNDLPGPQVQRLADQVYRVIEKKLRVERQRRGLV